jgi:hypothetical protein
MALYTFFLGRRVQVQYRASDTLLPASGVLVADSGRSIFLEQSFEQRGQHRHFRWEIPYQYLVKIAVTKVEEPSPDAGAIEVASLKAVATSSEPQVVRSVAPEKLVSRAAAAGGLSSALLPLEEPSRSS